MAKKIPFNTVNNSMGCIALARKDNFLYAAGGDNLSVYDISKPDKPELLWRRGGFGNGRQLAVTDGLLYMTAREYGLWIIDITTPHKPKKVTRYDTVELATGIAVAKDTVFVAQRIYGIEIIDVSRPDNPRHLSLIKTPEAQSCVYDQGKLYVGDWGAGCVTVIDVGDRCNPVVLKSVGLGGYGDGVAVANGYCFAATGHNAKSSCASESELSGDGHGLDIFRLKGADKLPEHLSRINFPVLEIKSNDFWTVKTAGKNVFVADTHNGLFQVNVSDPANPKISGRIELPSVIRVDSRAEKRVRVEVPDCVGDVAVGVGVIYIAGQKTGLHVAEISGVSTESPSACKSLVTLRTGTPKHIDVSGMSRVDCEGQVRRVALDKNILYAACSHAGIRVMRLSGNKTTALSVIPVKCCYDVSVSDGKLYSAEGTDGVAVYSLYPECKEIGRFKVKKRIFQLLRICGNGKFAACGCRDGLLRMLDVSDTSSIRQVFNHLHGGLMYGDTFPEKDVDNLFPVIWPYRGLAWYDLSRDKPILVYDDVNTHPAGQYEGITHINGKYLMSTLKNTFHSMNLSDCGKTWTEILNGCSGVPSSNGNIVAFSLRSSGSIRLYRMTKSGAEYIKERSFADIKATPDRVVFYKGRMIIPCGHQGLLLENK